MVAFLITDYGSHSAYKWAEVGANEIGDLIQLGANVSPSVVEAKHKFIFDLRVGLEPKYASYIDASQKVNYDNLNRDYKVSNSVLTDAVMVVVNTSLGTPFEDHFTRLEVQLVLASIIGNHFATIDHIERSNFVDAAITFGKPSAAVQEFVSRHRT